MHLTMTQLLFNMTSLTVWRELHWRCVQIGVYNEQSLERLDLVLSEAAKSGIRIIFPPFVNFWPDLGGMQWYVDQVWPGLLAFNSAASLLCDLRGKLSCLDPSSHAWLCASPPSSGPGLDMGYAAGYGLGYAPMGHQLLLVVGVGREHFYGPIDGNRIILGQHIGQKIHLVTHLRFM